MPRKTTPAAVRVGRTLVDAAQVPRRLDERLRPVALLAGWLGFAAAAGCALLHATPDAHWPTSLTWLTRDRLPACATLSLVTASLLGWAYMQEGQSRIERRVGRRWSLVLFVLLPIAAAAIAFVEAEAPLEPATRERTAWLFLAARWYAAAAVVANLVAFGKGRLAARRRGRAARAVAFGVLVAPYLLLLAALVLGVRLPWLDHSLRGAIDSLGTGGVAVQLAIAWFVGSGP